MIRSAQESDDGTMLEDTLLEIRQVFESVVESLADFDDKKHLNKLKNQFATGKMLRTRLGIALYNPELVDYRDLITACAATELIHTATLFHDDVIDGASLRRRSPSLWREVGATGAILLGDLFFSSALQLVVRRGNIQHIDGFVGRVREVCAAEVTHELVYRSRHVDAATCLGIARGKTGPLFAHVAEVCGGSKSAVSDVFREIGYRLGTAYQLFDDLIDIAGDEGTVGKTLGTDRKRRKFTLAQEIGAENEIRTHVEELCASALDLIPPWTGVHSSVNSFIQRELLPQLSMTVAGTKEKSLSNYEVG